MGDVQPGAELGHQGGDKLLTKVGEEGAAAAVNGDPVVQDR